MRDTAPVTVVVVHGAGSTGAAAARLVGCGPDSLLIEDRSGDVDTIIERIDEALQHRSDVTDLVGVSLGAHAVARWAGRAPRRVPHLTCVLPAWTAEAGAAARLTAASARSVADEGIDPLLARLHTESAYPDVVALLAAAWADYTDASLASALECASTGKGPSAEDLAAIAVPVAVVGWSGDAFHPEDVARAWARHLRHPTVAIAARPEARLLRQALATCGAPRRDPPAARE